MDEPARAQPIRAYVGLESADTEEERVALTLRELERTGAFDRAYILVASPTGTGYVNYAAASILEFLSRGDCATVAMQYSARPSPLSLDRVAEGRHHARMLLAALRDRLAQCAEGTRPTLVLFGESLGAWTSQDAYADRGTQGLVDDGVDYAIWIGTPHFSKWKERVLYDDRPDVDRSLVGVCNDIGEWHALDPETRGRIRYMMITHYDDGVAVFGPELAVQAPDWLGDPESRPGPVPKGMRWMPSSTFFQVLVDMKNAANVVPGVFAAGPRLPRRPPPVLPRAAGVRCIPGTARPHRELARSAGAVAEPMDADAQDRRSQLGGNGARTIDPGTTRRGTEYERTPDRARAHGCVRGVRCRRWRRKGRNEPVTDDLKASRGRWFPLLALAVALVLVAAACGGDDDDSSNSGSNSGEVDTTPASASDLSSQHWQLKSFVVGSGGTLSTGSEAAPTTAAFDGARPRARPAATTTPSPTSSGATARSSSDRSPRRRRRARAISPRRSKG